MATDRQIQANRANAQRSTGPRTPEGKAQVRYNAMTHGLLAQAALLPDEDEETFREFSDALTDDLAPVGDVEASLAARIVNIAWRLRRLSEVEAGLFIHARAANEEAHCWAAARSVELHYHDWYRDLSVLTTAEPLRILDEKLHADAVEGANQAAALQRTPLARLGAAFSRDAAEANAFGKLSRYEAALVRDFHRTITTIRTLQEARLS